MNVWPHIHAALDERRNPLDDPRVQEHLLDHPEDLAAVLDLNDALRAVATTEPVAFDARARRGAVVLAAVVALFILVVPTGPPKMPTPTATVHSWQIVVTTERRGLTTTSVSSKQPGQPPRREPTIHHQTVNWTTP